MYERKFVDLKKNQSDSRKKKNGYQSKYFLQKQAMNFKADR